MNWKDELEEICGEEYIEAVEELIKSLLKKQRENIEFEILFNSQHLEFTRIQVSRIKEACKINAPEPGEK